MNEIEYEIWVCTKDLMHIMRLLHALEEKPRESEESEKACKDLGEVLQDVLNLMDKAYDIAGCVSKKTRGGDL